MFLKSVVLFLKISLCLLLSGPFGYTLFRGNTYIAHNYMGVLLRAPPSRLHAND